MGQASAKETALRVLKRLRAAGHEALFAGGCVRDMLLGGAAADYDVATSATPDQVRSLFPRVLMVGAKFGVAMVLWGGRKIEVTTFRTDLSYSDGRRPESVQFVTARQDALRRDFTINGMFYDPLADKVVDYVGGQEDLRAGVIRAIGDPEVRFGEDYLRMLRAARFSARFGFPIEPATAEAIGRHAPKIKLISGERVREELEKIFRHAGAGAGVRQLHELGLLEAILPELCADPGTLSAALAQVQALAAECNIHLSMACLLAGLGEGQIEAVTRRWGASNELRVTLVWIGGHLDDWRTMQQAPLAPLKGLLAHRHYRLLEHLWRVRELHATGGKSASAAIRRRVEQIDPAQIAPPPLVSGRHLKRLGLAEGPLLGKVLAKVYEAQLNEEIHDRRQGLELARRLLEENK